VADAEVGMPLRRRFNARLRYLVCRGAGYRSKRLYGPIWWLLARIRCGAGGGG